MTNFDNVGRNDPCPCGSGKNFKKCCGKDQRPDLSGIPAEFQTNTPLDNYLQLMPVLMAWLRKELEFGDHKTELKKTARDFELKFKPGEPGGITDSLFMAWQLFDLRYGKSQRTVGERFMAQEMFERLPLQPQNMVRQMAGTYHAWYRLHKIEPEWFTLIELGTEREWHTSRVGEPEVHTACVGELWHTRLVGTPELAYIFSAPFIEDAKAEHDIRTVLDHEWEQYRREQKNTKKDEASFRGYCKHTVRFWAGFLLRHQDVIMKSVQVLQKQDAQTPLPQMVNYDGDEILPTRMHFKIMDAAKVTARLAKIKGMLYDATAHAWDWSKPSKKKKALGDTVHLGHIKIEDDTLTAETNSVERAMFLRATLLNACGEALVFERQETTSLAAMPEPTEEERRNMEEEDRQLQADPQVRAMLAQKLRDYYLKEWVHAKVPMLGNITPHAAAKTEKGRVQLRKMLNEFEHTDRKDGTSRTQMDWDGLRKQLGI